MPPKRGKNARAKNKAAKAGRSAPVEETKAPELSVADVTAAAVRAAGGEEEISPADKLAAMGVVATYATNQRDLHPNARDINVQNLTLQFHGAILLEETDLVLNYGNRYAIVGPNGCGKSTLLEVLGARGLPMPSGIDLFHLKEEIEASEKTALEAVLEVDNERAALDAEAHMLADVVAENPENDEASDRLNQVYERLDELDADTAEARASQILTGLQFTQAMQNKKTKEFSGGWRMRIMLARALFLAPMCLVLDEPTNHLDMDAVVWLEDYLSKWTKILFMVSHSQDFMNTVCTHVIHMTNRKLEYFSGDYDQYVQTRHELEENQMKRYNWEQEQIRHMKEYIARFGHGSSKLAKQAQSKEKTLEKMIRAGLTPRVERENVLNFKFMDPGTLPPPVLQFQNVSFCYPNCEDLYTELHFGVDLDSRVALVGANGAGKSTLLKLMCGELQPTVGDIRPHSHLKIARFTQHFVDVLDLSMTPLEYMMHLHPDKTRDTMRSWLGRYGCSGRVQTQQMSQLSDGQKARVVISWMAAQNPHLLLLDEPTNHLDMESIDALAVAINQFSGGMFLVSHDMRLISQVAEEIWLCEDRTIRRYEGEISDFKMQLRRNMNLEDEAAALARARKLRAKKKRAAEAAEAAAEAEAELASSRVTMRVLGDAEADAEVAAEEAAAGASSAAADEAEEGAVAPPPAPAGKYVPPGRRS